MFLKLLILMSFIFPLSSIINAVDLAPDNAEFINHIECILNDLEGGDCAGQNPSCQMESWETEVFEPQPFQQCVQDICKDKTSNLGKALADSDNESQNLFESTRARFGANLGQLYDQLQNLAKKGKEKFEKDPDFLAEARNYTWLLSQMSDFLHSYTRVAGHGRLPPTFNDFQALLGGEFSHWDQDLLRELYTIQKGASDSYLSSDEYQNMDQSIIGTFERQHYLGKVEQRIRALPDSFPDKWGLFQKLQRVQSANLLSPEKITDSLYGELWGLSQGLYMAEAVANDPYSQVLAKRYEDSIKNDFTGFTLYDELLEGTDKAQFLGSCQDLISRQAAVLVSQEEKKRIENLIQNAQNLMIGRLRGKLSIQTYNKVVRQAVGKEPSLPPSREEFLAKMEGNLLEQKTMQTAMADQFLGSVATLSSLNAVDLANEVCSLPLNLSGNASALTTSGHVHDHKGGTITLGALTLKDFNQNGLWIFAHELGHIVSGIISREGSKESFRKYKNSRECLSAQQSGGGISKLFKQIQGDSLASGQKNEEDFADLFSFEFLPEVSNGPCLFFNNGTGYSGEENLLKNPELEKHSPSLYRLFHAQKYSGDSLPNSCKQELDLVSDKPKFKNCWK